MFGNIHTLKRSELGLYIFIPSNDPRSLHRTFINSFCLIMKVKAENALLPVYRKELRKVLLENLQWMRAMKKDPTFQKVMETQKELKDTEGFD